jgi:hypothetical protein
LKQDFLKTQFSIFITAFSPSKKEKPQAKPEVFLEIIVKMRIIDINITSFRQKVND